MDKLAQKQEENQMPSNRGNRRFSVGFAGLLLVTLGSFIVPPIAWLIGIFLIWRCGYWNIREKIAVTLIWPGGWWFLLAVSVGTNGRAGGCDGGDPCLPGNNFSHALPSFAWLAMLAMSLVVIAVLGMRLVRGGRVDEVSI